jgi:uncharacterized protein
VTTSAVLSTPEKHCASAQPVGLRDRIPTLDAIRGLGVLGILIVNIQSFALVSGARSVAIADGDKAITNYAIWFLTQVFADGKFMLVFSLLFGAGICLMSDRIEAKGLNSAPIHFRRMAFLVTAGLLHSYLLWSGDILFTYGLCGSVCWLFRRSSPRRLFLLGLMTLVIGQYITRMVWAPPANGFLSILYQALQEILRIPPAASPIQETLVYRGTWIQQMVLRIPDSLNAEIGAFWVVTFWRTSGAFLIGMGLFKVGFFTGTRDKVIYRWLLLIAAASVLISAIACYICLIVGPATVNGFLADFQLNYWLSLPIGLGWAALGILIVKLDKLQFLKAALQAVGRTAFTNYIMQTLICTTLFYGHGLGLFGRLDRLQLMSLMLLIWITQTIASAMWLRFFAYGPIEWLLRRVTYWHRLDGNLPDTAMPLRRLNLQEEHIEHG